MNIKKRAINAGILIMVFIIAVIFFSYITNRENGNMTADMGAATFPQVSFSCGEYGVNTLPGYSEKMDVPSMRDTITPVLNKKLTMNVKAYDNKISQIKYTVYSLDGKEKILEQKVKKASDSVEIDLSVGETLTEERVLEAALTLEEDKIVYFYTRIVDADQFSISECLNYIDAFHKNALDKVEGAGIGTAIEPSEKADNTTFQHVTINSDYNHVTWGELAPVVEGGERWSIKESNENYTSVLLEYKVRCKGEENDEDIYTIKEFFRVRHTPQVQKTYLLDYDRTMTQIFDSTKKMVNEKGILLGIAPFDTPYMVNGNGNVVSFVQANELWNYNKNTDEVSLVFSFADAENTDSRCQMSRHQVKLLAADKDGSTTFAVYGYMNRGEHEGEVGVAIYYYDINKNSVDEKAFISSDKSFGHAVYEFGKLVYYSVERDMLYVMVDGNLYEINVQKEEKKALVKNLEDSQYVVSEDGHLAAYQSNGKLSEATKVVIIDFKNGTKRTVEAGDGECIRPLGFVKNDFVYGLAKTADIGKTVSGDAVVPLYKVEIKNRKNKVIKTYEQDGTYILDAQFEDNMITLKRAGKSGTTYTSTADDYITNNEEKKESNITLGSYTTELKETQYRILYANGITDKEPKVLKPKQVLFENRLKLNFDKADMSDNYYVYGHGELRGIFKKAGEAIKAANEYSGVVVSATQSYVWERGNRKLQYSITDKDEEINQIRQKLTAGEAPIDIMNNISDKQGIDLTGCSSEELLYLINQGTPVIAMLDATNSVILTGYTELYISYTDTASGERRSATYAEMDNMTAGSGNAFISYIK